MTDPDTETSAARAMQNDGATLDGSPLGRRLPAAIGSPESATLPRMSRRAGFLLGLVLATGLPAVAQAHGGHGSVLPVLACESRAHGDGCAYEDAHRDVYRGTCRSMGGALRCVRTQPIARAASAPEAPTEPELPLAPLTAGLFSLASALVWVRHRRRPST